MKDTFDMEIENYIKKASVICREQKNKQITNEHIFFCMLEQNNTLTCYLEFLNKNINIIKLDIQKEINLFQITLREVKITYSNNTLKLFEISSNIKKDEKIGINEIIKSFFLVDGFLANYLKINGINRHNFEKYLKSISNKILKKYTINLNELALNEPLEEFIGREDEQQRIIQILLKKNKNNPLILGAPGVGKTTLIKSLVLRITKSNIPFEFQNKIILQLDLLSIFSGLKYAGELEERAKEIFDTAIKNKNIIILIDDIQNIMKERNNLSDIIKTYLNKNLKLIGISSFEDYKKFIENDLTFIRRFQNVIIDEPNEDLSFIMIMKLKNQFEDYYKIKISKQAILASIKLSSRYIHDKSLPDKALDLIDEGASKLKLDLSSKPKELDRLCREIEYLNLKRDFEEDALAKLIELKDKEKKIKEDFEKQKGAVLEIKELRKRIESLKTKENSFIEKGNYTDASEIRYSAIPRLQKEISVKLEGLSNKELLEETLEENHIAKIISLSTNIPVAKMLSSEKEKLLDLENILSKKIIGQKDAISLISHSIRRNKLNISDNTKPIGVFLFAGKTGVGKTETARVLSEFLFDDRKALLKIDMSEYQESSSISKLIGAPPGYVGYKESGILTESIKRKPYQIILFDEIEKAHSDIFNLLLQVFDEGVLSDSTGYKVDFTNTIIIMTSNIGSNEDKIDKKYLLSYFKSEFINRIDEIILFENLNKENMNNIFDLYIENINKRITNKIKIDKNLKDYIISKTDTDYGGREVKRLIQKYIENNISLFLLKNEIEKESLFIKLTDKEDVTISIG